MKVSENREEIFTNQEYRMNFVNNEDDRSK